MTSEAYKAERKLRGTQAIVAKLLGVHPVTITRRETGALPVTREAGLALLSLPEKRKSITNGDVKCNGNREKKGA